MKKGLQRKLLGFTLVEIMIVVTIIGILASLAVPAFQRARWKALETSIRNNLRQIWGAAQQYMLENGVSEITAENYKEIFLWRTKNGTGGTAGADSTNPGYTSVIQQIAEESYDTIYVYDSTSITNFNTDEKEAGDVPTSNTTLSEDTQGLAVSVGSEGNLRYVKLRL